MKKFLALSLALTTLAGCHAAPTSSTKAVTSDDLLPDTEFSTENSPGFCSIDWTDAKLADVSKAGDMDKPLLLDVAEFKAHAEKQLSVLFGEVNSGTLYYQDMFGSAIVGGKDVHLDIARLFYTATAPEEMKLPENISIAYAVSAAGELNIGFANIGERFVDFVYPGMMVVFNSQKIERDVFLARMNEYKKTIAPDLIWNKGEEINPTLFYWVPIALPKNSSEKQVKQFVELWKKLASDPAIDSLELDGEAIPGTPTHGEKILVSGSEASIDMNALRSVSKRQYLEGKPFSTIPSLAKPFGIGCKIENPLLAL